MSSLSTFGAFTTARLGIYASMKGLSVTGNNIANINTVGYTRQSLDQISLYMNGSDRYASFNDARVGQGVLCTGVSQLRDPYLDIRFRNEQARVGEMSAKLEGLKGLSQIFDEVGMGEEWGVIEKQMNDLVNQLQNLNTENAGKDEFDSLVRSSAKALVTLFNSYSKQLDTLKQNQDTKFRNELTEVNSILSNIRDLNESIRKSEVHGDGALEMRDSRNLLIDKLSQYMKINVTYESEEIGAGRTVQNLVITMDDANKTPLINGIYGTQLSLRQVPKANPDYDPAIGLPYLDADGNPASLGSAALVANPAFATDPTQPPYLDAGNNPTADPDQAARVANPDHDPADPNGFPYLDKDGNPTNVLGDAEIIDSPNYDLDLAALKDKFNQFMESVTKSIEPGYDYSDRRTQADLQDLLTNPANPNYANFQPTTQIINGKTVTTSYEIVSKKFKVPNPDPTDVDNPFIKETRYALQKRVASTANLDVQLPDNDPGIYGALQSAREILTEEGQFSTDDALAIDSRATSKRGIPYYQKALDALANKFATVLNEANQPYRTDADGNYLTAAGEPIYGADGNPINKGNKLSAGDKAILEGEAYYNTDGGKYIKADGSGPVTRADGSEILLTATLTEDDKKLLAQQSLLVSPDPVPANAKQQDACQRVGANLFSNSGDSDDTTNITAGNISITKSWSVGKPRIQSTSYTDANGKPILSRDNTNITHIVAQFGNANTYSPGEMVANGITGTRKDTPYFEGTFQEMLADISATLGDDMSVTMVMLDNYSSSALELDTSRDAVASVDLNDEAANLMQYQKSYSAACRLMTTIDEALDKLINGTGVVGR